MCRTPSTTLTSPPPSNKLVRFCVERSRRRLARRPPAVTTLLLQNLICSPSYLSTLTLPKRATSEVGGCVCVYAHEDVGVCRSSCGGLFSSTKNKNITTYKDTNPHPGHPNPFSLTHAHAHAHTHSYTPWSIDKVLPCDSSGENPHSLTHAPLTWVISNGRSAAYSWESMCVCVQEQQQWVLNHK